MVLMLQYMKQKWLIEGTFVVLRMEENVIQYRW